MLNLFLSGRGRTVFILPLIILVFGLKSFFNPSPIIDSPSYLFAKFDLIFHSMPYLKLVIGLIIISLMAIYINKVFNNNGFYQTENSLPSLLFVIMIGAWTGFHFFSPIYLTLFFLLLGLNRILQVYHQKVILSEVFDAGFFLGVAAVFYYPTALFIISIWIYISMNRAFNFREYFLPLLGMALPFFFLSVFYFYFDLPYDFLIYPIESGVDSLINLGSLTQRIFLVITGVAFLLSVPFYIKHISRSKLKTKNSRRLMLVLLLNSVIIYILSFTFFPIHNRELLLVLPMVFIMPFYFYSVSTLYQNLLFYFWIIAALLFNFIPSI